MHLKYYLLCFLFCLLFSKIYAKETKPFTTSNLPESFDDKSELEILKNWQFYYGKNLSANEMKRLPEKEKLTLYNPYTWANKIINGKKLPAFGTATYYLKIKSTGATTQHPVVYGLYVGCIESAYKLIINDKLIGSKGKVGSDKTNYLPCSLPAPYYFTVNTDSIDIVLHVSNFILPISSAFTRNIYFGKPKAIEQLLLKKIVITCFMLGLFVLILIQQLILIFLSKYERSHIILSLLCILFIFKLSADSNLITTFHLLSEHNTKLYYQIWALSLLCAPLIMELIKISFPKEASFRIEKWIYLLYIPPILVILTTNIELITKMGFILVFISSLCIGYIYIILIKAIKANRKYAIVHAFGVIILVLFFIYDVFSSTSAHYQGYFTTTAIGLYILIQSQSFPFKLTASNKQNIKQATDLKKTNFTLESAVAQRTNELQLANEELSRINKQKDFLISTISHDLMNTFNVLLTFPRLLYQDRSLPDNYRSNMEMIYKAAENGHSILENMLEWTKLHINPKDNLQPIENLSDIVRQNVELQTYYVQRKNIRIETEINDKFHFYCQKEQLNAILRNLISNAIKFSKDGGTVNIKNRIKNGWVQILIVDKGIGISSDMRELLFRHTNNKKRFGTHGEKGAGIGLLIIKDLVESNNGQISCYSKQNKTTVFIVEFKLLSYNANETNINY